MRAYFEVAPDSDVIFSRFFPLGKFLFCGTHTWNLKRKLEEICLGRSSVFGKFRGERDTLLALPVKTASVFT